MDGGHAGLPWQLALCNHSLLWPAATAVVAVKQLPAL